MKVTLIAPPLMDYVDGVLSPIAMDAVRACPPYGVFLLAQVLQQDGHEVTIIDLIAQGSKDLDIHWQHIASSHLVGISTTTLSWPTARQCISDVRKYRPDVPIVLGGIHATMFDKYLLATTQANYCIRGEGENALRILARTLQTGGDLSHVPNLTAKLANGHIQRTHMAEKMSGEAMGQLPFPDYSGLPDGVYNGLGIESSRGCLFDCLFCSTSYRKSWRSIAPEIFVDRLEYMMPYLSKTRTGTLQIIDDEFSIKTDRAIAICEEIARRNLSPRLIFDSRANDLLNEAYVEAIMPYAFQFLIGAECGYDKGLSKVGKGTTIKKLEQAAAVLNKYGLAERADFSFIIGLPWETKKEVLETVNFACNLYAKYGVRVMLQWFCQIPGSRLWDERRKQGVVHEAHYDDFGFFKNLYLFRTGVNLTPDEIYEVSDMVSPVVAMSSIHKQEKRMVEYAFPEPISMFYPRMPGEIEEDLGLASLREVAGVAKPEKLEKSA